MVLTIDNFILLRYGRRRIFHFKERSLSTCPLKLFHKGAIFCNGRVLNLDFYNSGGITRRFLYNTQINLDSSNVEPISAEVQAFQEYLKCELDAMKQKLERTKKWAIEKDGYMKLRIDDINGSQIRFPLKDVRACKKIKFK